MQTKKIILAIIALFLILLAFVGYMFRADLETILQPKVEKKTIRPVEEISKDTIPYKEYLKKELKVIEVKKQRKSNREIWRLGKGPAIINYLLKAQNHIRLYEGKVLDMEQTYHVPDEKNPTYQSATIDFTDFKGDTVSVELQISREIFVEGSSKMSIVFEGTNYDETTFEQLAKLEYPFTVLITPAEIYPDTNTIREGKLQSLIYKKQHDKSINVSKTLNEEMQKFMNRISIRQANINQLRNNPNCSIVLWPFLESTRLNASHSAPIRMYHRSDHIQNFINTALEQFPEAKGFATRLGEQAVERSSFMNEFLSPLQNKDLYFLNLTGTNNSIVNGICNKYELACDAFTMYNPDNSTIENYVTKTLKNAIKFGNSVIILPLQKDMWKYLQNIKEQASQQGTEIIPLTELIHLRQ